MRHETGWVEAFVLQRDPLELDPDNGVGDLIAAERAHIHRELLEAIGAIKIASDNGTDILCVSTLTAALDRICPEGKGN